MNTLVVVLVCLAVVLYIRYNMKFQDKYEILQLPPSKLTPSILSERNPIVIQNAEDVADIIKKSFKYTYMYKVEKVYDLPIAGKPLKVNARFAIVTPVAGSSEGIDVEIINPKYKGDDYQSVVVKMQQGQALVLPIFWRLKTETSVRCTFLHDMFSCFYQSIGS
jgi:hypothetical protein